MEEPGVSVISKTSRKSITDRNASTPLMQKSEVVDEEEGEEGQEGHEGEGEEEVMGQIADDLLLNPSPFTPSPMLPYSIWGVPVTPKNRVRMSGRVTEGFAFFVYYFSYSCFNFNFNFNFNFYSLFYF